MKTAWLIVLSVFVAALPGCPTTGLSRAEREKMVPGPAPNRVVRLDLTAKLADIPAGGRELRLWTPMLQSDSHQNVVERHVLSSLRPMVRYDPVFNDGMMYFTGDEPLPAGTTVTVWFRVELHRCPPLDVVGTTALTAEQVSVNAMFLQTNDAEEGLKQALSAMADRISHEREQDRPALMLEETTLKEKYESLAAGNATLREAALTLKDASLSPRNQTRKVYDFVREKLKTTKEAVPAERTLFEAWQSGRVTSLEYARITVFMLRTLEVPARVEFGVDLGQSDTDSAPAVEAPGPAIWVGAYLSPGFWFPIDPVAAENKPELADYYFGTDCASRIRFGWGTGINLVPQQIGEALPTLLDARAEVDDKVIPVEFTITAKDMLTQPVVEKKK